MSGLSGGNTDGKAGPGGLGKLWLGKGSGEPWQQGSPDINNKWREIA